MLCSETLSMETGTPSNSGKMFPLGRLNLIRDPTRIDHLIEQASPLILTSLIVFVIIHGLMLIQLSNGGSDLVSADIPKSLMLLQGENPYSVNPWASPYPPLLLLVDSGIIRTASLFNPQSSIDAISQNIRIAGLFADATVAILIYLYLRRKTSSPLTPLISAGLFVTLPALSISPLYFFHSDTFGYPILATSLVALAARRYLIGTSLLATATIFKIHPILALPLIMVWQARNRGPRATIPSIISTSTILTVGLLLPLTIPGYAQSVLGFNLANNGNETTLSTTLGLVNNILPRQVQITPSTLLANQAWIAVTLALYTIIVRTVWARARSLETTDIILLGLLAWLIPLKIEYTHYVAWSIIPVLMRGRMKQTIPVLGLLQLGDALSYWSWWPSISPLPGIDSFYGLLTASAVYRAVGLVTLGFIFYSLRARTRAAPPTTLEENRLLFLQKTTTETYSVRAVIPDPSSSAEPAESQLQRSAYPSALPAQNLAEAPWQRESFHAQPRGQGLSEEEEMILSKAALDE